MGALIKIKAPGISLRSTQKEKQLDLNKPQARDSPGLKIGKTFSSGAIIQSERKISATEQAV